jgi:hypothetical protein
LKNGLSLWISSIKRFFISFVTRYRFFDFIYRDLLWSLEFRRFKKTKKNSSVVDPDPPGWIYNDFDRMDPDPDPGGLNDPQKRDKSEEVYCFEVLNVLFYELEGFSCSLDVLHGGLGINI